MHMSEWQRLTDLIIMEFCTKAWMDCSCCYYYSIVVLLLSVKGMQLKCLFTEHLMMDQAHDLHLARPNCFAISWPVSTLGAKRQGAYSIVNCQSTIWLNRPSVDGKAWMHPYITEKKLGSWGFRNSCFTDLRTEIPWSLSATYPYSRPTIWASRWVIFSELYRVYSVHLQTPVMRSVSVHMRKFEVESQIYSAPRPPPPKLPHGNSISQGTILFDSTVHWVSCNFRISVRRMYNNRVETKLR